MRQVQAAKITSFKEITKPFLNKKAREKDFDRQTQQLTSIHDIEDWLIKAIKKEKISDYGYFADEDSYKNWQLKVLEWEKEQDFKDICLEFMIPGYEHFLNQDAESIEKVLLNGSKDYLQEGKTEAWKETVKEWKAEKLEEDEFKNLTLKFISPDHILDIGSYLKKEERDKMFGVFQKDKYESWYAAFRAWEKYSTYKKEEPARICLRFISQQELSTSTQTDHPSLAEIESMLLRNSKNFFQHSRHKKLQEAIKAWKEELQEEEAFKNLTLDFIAPENISFLYEHLKKEQREKIDEKLFKSNQNYQEWTKALEKWQTTRKTHLKMKSRPSGFLNFMKAQINKFIAMIFSRSPNGTDLTVTPSNNPSESAELTIKNNSRSYRTSSSQLSNQDLFNPTNNNNSVPLGPEADA